MSVQQKNGVPVGVIEGYLSTWDEDTGGKFGIPDQFVRGAFAKSLAEHRARGMRPIRLKDMHGRTIGGFPIETAREDERGLFVVGEINLDTDLGREVFSLAKQGVLTDLSVGFIAIRDEIVGGRKRLIHEAQIVEGSVVDEPANRHAKIISVKLRGAADLESARRRPSPMESIVRDLRAASTSLRGSWH
jgi:HK97 family phage prohead protease